MRSFLAAWSRCLPATKLSLFAALCAMLNPMVGLTVGLGAGWLYTRTNPIDFKRHLAAWYFAPVALALLFIGQGDSLPSDDLMRHLSAWELGYDYRAQYPWSSLPKANLWLGFDWLLGTLQRAGVSKQLLLQWIPGLSVALQSLVLFGALCRAVPKRHRNAELFLLAGALGLMALTPRSLLGRPEMFLLIFGASAGLCRTRGQAVAWVAGFLVLIPAYWLGWVYAPFALLMAQGLRALAARLVICALLVLVHLAFWHAYTGDYVALLLWLKDTLHVPAGENAPLHQNLSFWFMWVVVGALGLAISTLNLRRALLALPVLMLLCWFALPNQLRYGAAVAMVALPWLYQVFAALSRARQVTVPSIVVVLALAVSAALAVFKTDEHPRFALDKAARVYSESPYAAVFYGQPGIAVEPSFALGATRPQWRGLVHEGRADCDLLKEGGFTHVIEKTVHQPLSCAELVSVQGPWRLWALKKD